MVEDAISKVRIAIEQGRYYQAQAGIKKAEQIIEKDKGLLGDKLFNKYKKDKR